jgi:hypothetical protein
MRIDSRIDLTALCSEREARALAEKKSLRYPLIYLFSARQNASIVCFQNLLDAFKICEFLKGKTLEKGKNLEKIH